MGEWMERHEELVKKPSTERVIVSVDDATRELLDDLGISFQEVKTD